GSARQRHPQQPVHPDRNRAHRTDRDRRRAALLVAIGAFVTSKLIFIKKLGLGIALAVLIDAFVIRTLLVPSLMALLGKWNWWAPRPLRRLHRRPPGARARHRRHSGLGP